MSQQKGDYLQERDANINSDHPGLRIQRRPLIGTSLYRLALGSRVREYQLDNMFEARLARLRTAHKPRPEVLIFFREKIPVKALVVVAQQLKSLCREGHKQQIQLEHAAAAVPKNLRGKEFGIGHSWPLVIGGP